MRARGGLIAAYDIHAAIRFLCQRWIPRRVTIFPREWLPPVAGYIPGCCNLLLLLQLRSLLGGGRLLGDGRRRERQCFAQMDQSPRSRNDSNRPRRRGCLLLRLLLQYGIAVSTSHRRLQTLNNYYKRRQFNIAVEGGNDIIFTTVVGSPS